MEHEFLVVHACHPSGSKIVLGVDRNAEALPTVRQTSESEATPSTSLASSAKYLDTLIRFGSPSSSSDTSSQQPAYDGVQVSHDATPAPVLAQHGPSVPLSTVSFTSCATATGEMECPRPSLLHLTILLFTIRSHFPSYALLQYQCYFFARATCLALLDLFGGAETVHEEGGRRRRGAGCTYLFIQRDAPHCRICCCSHLWNSPHLSFLPVVCSVQHCEAIQWECGGERDGQAEISDEKIREYAIPLKYSTAWRSFKLDGSKA
ncbi:hypothetical protein B0F90DRAFT_951762 [Multifurca ochricompacta]|uniref:Uncharacterized protein n=1 Tax=Multifurca ochricompacta TaxID=376703 RepID=A0AAD4MAE4_9AGAM|nr:hypothetical protein B0F90DRAFT_951762 [Multifurca ochricompacta]